MAVLARPFLVRGTAGAAYFRDRDRHADELLEMNDADSRPLADINSRRTSALIPQSDDALSGPNVCHFARVADQVGLFRTS